jgi:hypothetical protein
MNEIPESLKTFMRNMTASERDRFIRQAQRLANEEHQEQQHLKNQRANEYQSMTLEQLTDELQRADFRSREYNTLLKIHAEKLNQRAAEIAKPSDSELQETQRRRETLQSQAKILEQQLDLLTKEPSKNFKQIVALGAEHAGILRELGMLK